jgi:hypothetical protein
MMVDIYETALAKLKVAAGGFHHETRPGAGGARRLTSPRLRRSPRQEPSLPVFLPPVRHVER